VNRVDAVAVDERDDAGLSWPRAVAISAVILAAGIGLVVVVTDLIISEVGSLDRHARVGLATLWFVVALSGLGWALRRLQARHVV
jgi:hypothetical protein